jgi:hypothetical protein
MRVALLCGLCAVTLAPSLRAEPFDWRDAAARKEMSVAFDHIATACSAGFGFTRIQPLPAATMVDKLHAYLLLRSDAEADAQVENWAEQIIVPINAMVAKKSEGPNVEDEHQAAAAAVAAAEDPDSYDEAKARFMDGAMAPFRHGLEACEAGARDSFLGKYYWTGSGNIDDYEKSMDSYFAELVAELRKPKKPKSGRSR